MNEEEVEIERDEELNDIYSDKIEVPIIIAGFITLGTGIAVLSKAVWMTSPLGDISWYVTLFVGILLVLIGIFAISCS